MAEYFPIHAQLFVVASIVLVIGVIGVMAGQLALRSLKLRIRTVLDSKENRLNKRLADSVELLYTQMEALISLNSVLQPRLPLPPTRGWAGSPDFLRELAVEILARKPKMVIELGSGVSSLVIAYCLQRNGHGKLVSLDHDGRYAEQTRLMLSQHGLSAQGVVLDAPLKEVACNGVKVPWYTLPPGLPPQAEMLVIDGPPSLENDNLLSRYPALPMLRTYLAPGALVVLDDAARPGEQECLARWRQEIGFAEYALKLHEKGTALFSLPSQSIPGDK